MHFRLHQKGAHHGYLDNRCFTGGGMAHILRLILFCAALFASSGVFAFANPTLYYHNYPPANAGFTSPESCIASAQAAMVLVAASNGKSGCSLSSPVLSGGIYSFGIGGCGINLSASCRPYFQCPSNSSGPGSSCTCNEGYDEVGSQCMPKCAADEERKDGVCRKKNPCPAGMHEQGGACVPDKCAADEIRVNGLCVSQCPQGEKKIDGVCKKPPKCEKGLSMNMALGSDPAICHGGCTYVAVSGLVCADGSCAKPFESTGQECNGTTDGGGGTNPGNGGGTTGGGGGTTGGGTTGGGTEGGGDPAGGTGGGTTGGGGGTTGGGTTGGGTSGGGGTTGGTTGGGTTGGGGGTTGGGTTGGGTEGGSGTTGGGGDGAACPASMEKVGATCVVKCSADHVRDGSGQCVYNGPSNGGGGTGGGGDPEGGTGSGGSDPGTGGGGTGPGTGSGGTDPGKGGGKPGNGDGEGDGDGDEDGEKDGKGFGGSCMAGFNCKGDAIQCAIAREQHRRACQLHEDKSDESELYNKEKAKEGDQTKDLKGNGDVDVAGKIDTGSAIGGGGCISDKQFTVMGTVFSIPFSTVCPYLRAFGDALVAVAFLVAMRIITRS